MIKLTATYTCNRCGYTKTYEASNRTDLHVSICKDNWEIPKEEYCLCQKCQKQLMDMIHNFYSESIASESKEGE